MSSVPPAGGQLFAGSLGPAGHSLSDVVVAKLRGQQHNDHVTGDRSGPCLGHREGELNGQRGAQHQN